MHDSLQQASLIGGIVSALGSLLLMGVWIALIVVALGSVRRRNPSAGAIAAIGGGIGAFVCVYRVGSMMLVPLFPVDEPGSFLLRMSAFNAGGIVLEGLAIAFVIAGLARAASKDKGGANQEA
jgi:hypothetical protein